jgi:two-component system response regulator YesN
MEVNLSTKKNSVRQSDLVVQYILSRSLKQLEDLSVESISNNLKINRTQLWRIFKMEKSMTLEEYIFRIKINQAACLLINKTDLTIKEVGKRIGYYCYDYFIRVFKQYFGITPGKYREMKNQKLN